MFSKLRSSFLLLMITLFLMACGSQTISSTPNVNSVGLNEQDLDPAVAEFVQTLSEHRESLGCPELIWDETAALVAYSHSVDMKDQGYFNHQNLDGESPFDRMRNAEMSFGAAAENIAAGYMDGGTVFQGWYNSVGHRVNMENCRYTHHGVGLFEGYWTHVFFKP